MPKIKLSDTTEKITNPGVKEVLRIYDAATDKAVADYIVRAGERVDETKPLTIFHPVDTWKRMTIEHFYVRDLREDVFRAGARVSPVRELSEIAAYREREQAHFWEEYLRQDMPHIYKVDLSDALYKLKQGLVETFRTR